MFPVPTRVIRHFVHEIPGHIFVELNAGTEYLCDGCKTLGSGIRFQCNTCHFQLHEYCAMCPAIISTFMHPQHPLTLATATCNDDRTCHVCGDDVEGLFYWCKDCEFNVHPACTQLPQSVRHAQHSAHPLMLQHSPPNWCAHCRGACNSWRYRCEVCSFDLHLECVLVSHDPPTQRALPPPYGGYGCGPPPPYGGYGYGCVASPHNMYSHVQPTQPYSGYAYDINGIPYPSPTCVAFPHNTYSRVQPPQPYSTGYAYDTNGFPYPSPTCVASPHNMYSHVQQPLPYSGYAYDINGVPSPTTPCGSSSQHEMCNHPAQAQGDGAATNGNGKRRKKTYAIIGQLLLGVLSNVIFGFIS